MEIKQSEDIPISFPVITITGDEYKLRFTAGAGFRLLKRGIDPARLKEAGEKWKAEGRAIDFMFEMLAAMLGREVDGRWKALGLTAEELADQLSIADLGTLAGAISQALKTQPAANTAEATPAPPDPQIQ